MRYIAFGMLPLAALSVAGAAEDPGLLERGRAARDAGRAFLLRTQNEDGSWGYHAQRKPRRIFAPVPGAHRSFKAATTALAVMALERIQGDDEATRASCRRGIDYLLLHARAKRSHGLELYNVWAFGYGLQCLAWHLGHLGGADEEHARRVREKMEDLVVALVLYQAVDGGWGYLDFRARTLRPSGDSMSFTTAAILVALRKAKAEGVAVPKRVLEKALRSLERCRTPEGSYVYSFSWRYYPLGLINRPAGSLARTPVCDLALHLWDRGVSVERLGDGVAKLLEHRKFARMGLHRPLPHESWYGVSGYFYLFGYYYAAECFRLLPVDRRSPWLEGLVREILVTRHPDGSFWDFPLYGYHKPYGTAYAVLALSLLLDEAQR